MSVKGIFRQQCADTILSVFHATAVLHAIPNTWLKNPTTYFHNR